MPRPPLNGNKAEKTNIVLPSALKKAAQKLAAARRISLSQLVTQLLAKASGEPS
jgi:predicted HicB family RNase H-like nuclease